MGDSQGLGFRIYFLVKVVVSLFYVCLFFNLIRLNFYFLFYIFDKVEDICLVSLIGKFFYCLLRLLIG